MARHAYLLFLYKRPGITFTAGTSRSPNTVNIFSHVYGSIVTNDMRDVLDVYASGDKI